jgi:ribosomal protein L16/L10AE
MQTGMSRAFGKTMGRAALVKPNQTLYIVGVKNVKAEIEARKLIKSIKARIACKTFIQNVMPPIKA